MNRKWPTMVAAIVVAAAMAPSAQAGMIITSASSPSAEGTGALYTGELEVISSTATSASFRVELTNTDDPTNGVITAFAFQLPSGSSASDATLNSVSGTGDDTIGPATGPPAQRGGWQAGTNVGVPSFGTYDVGVFTGPTWQGGNTGEGIAEGGTGEFELSIMGSGLGSLTQEQIINAGFVARFQGQTQGRSDVVQGQLQTVVPEPSTLAVGLGCILPMALVSYIRRRRKAESVVA